MGGIGHKIRSYILQCIVVASPVTASLGASFIDAVELGRSCSDCINIRYYGSTYQSRITFEQFLSIAPGTNCIAIMYALPTRDRIIHEKSISITLQNELMSPSKSFLRDVFKMSDLCGFVTSNFNSKVTNLLGEPTEAEPLIFGVVNRSLTRGYKIRYRKYDKYRVVRYDDYVREDGKVRQKIVILDNVGKKMILGDLAYGIYYCNHDDMTLDADDVVLDGSVLRFDTPSFITEGEDIVVSATRDASLNGDLTLHVLMDGTWRGNISFADGEAGTKTVVVPTQIDHEFRLWKGVEICIKTLNRSVISW